MTRDEIMDMAKEAGLDWQRGFVVDNESNRYEDFATLIANATLEAAAVKCDTEWNGDADTYEYSEACNECAAAIRSMKT